MHINIPPKYSKCVMEKLGVNPIQDGGGSCKNRPPTSFSLVTSTNAGISPPPKLSNFKFEPSASPRSLNLNQDHPSKNGVFWSNPYIIEVVITALIEMLELQNFSHMNRSTK